MAGRARVVIAVGAAVAVIGGAAVAVRAYLAGPCSSDIQLVVDATTEIAPAVRAAGDRFTATHPEVRGDCVQVQVNAAESADVADRLSGAGTGARPTVWIPDSSSWLTRVQRVDRQAFEPQVSPVATSQVVLAATGTFDRTRLSSLDPRRSTAGLAGAGWLYDSIVTDPNKLVDMVRAYRSIAIAPDRAALLESAADRTIITSEQQVLSSDGGLTAQPLDPPVTLDYPFAVVSDRPANALAAAELFRAFLARPDTREAFTRLGFRGPDGSTGPSFPTGHGVSQSELQVRPLSDEQKITDVLGYWNATTSPSRVLTLVDVTSSMTRPIAKGGPSRLEVLRKTATDGLGLFTDDSELGLWAYGAGYQQVVPVSSLNSGQRARLTSAVASAKAAPSDVCGLYETVLAAYQSLKDGYKEGRSNTVVVFTDGANSKPGMSLETLKLELERATDPTRPVRVVLLGVGPDVNKAELDEIATTTGGRAFVVQDPQQIGNIFLQALIRAS